jgi:glucose/arabinose dehydrogenase
MQAGRALILLLSHKPPAMKHLLTLLTICTTYTVFAQPPTISYQAVSLSPSLSAPVDVVSANDGTNRLFIVQQSGRIRVINGTTVSEFLNVGGPAPDSNFISTGGEQGLLSMAFHPDYNGTTNRYFFIYYTNRNSDLEIRRYQTVAGNINRADTDPATNTVIITIPHPGQTNHNGAKLNFGADGYLYFATGDGGGGNDPSNNAQNGNSLLGKMLRIDINNTSAFGNYAVPADNPFVSDPNVDDRIWALGLRNPFRWSFDRLTGAMWIGDVGQGAQEEVHYRPAGSTGGVNYGWRCFEGHIPTPGLQPCTLNSSAPYAPPVYDYPNPSGSSSSVTGGYVYRGTEYPNFRGYYIAADVYSGQVHILWPRAGGGFDSSVQAGSANGVVGFGEDENGVLYAVSLFTNTLYKVVATGGTALPVRLSNVQLRKESGYNEINWIASSEEDALYYRIQHSFNGSSFIETGKQTAGTNREGRYTFRHYTNSNASLFYRIAVEKRNGALVYSDVLRVPGEARNQQVYPTIVKGQSLMLSAVAADRVVIMNSQGAQVLEQNLNGFTGVKTIELPVLAKGLYLVMIQGNDGRKQTERIIVE